MHSNQDSGDRLLATQRTEEGEGGRLGYVLLAGSLLISCGVFSFGASLLVTSIIHNYWEAFALCFGSFGVIYYVMLHFTCRAWMARFDSRVLHEFAKRKLIELQPIDDEAELVAQS